MSQRRFNSIIILSLHKPRTDNINVVDITNDFLQVMMLDFITHSGRLTEADLKIKAILSSNFVFLLSLLAFFVFTFQFNKLARKISLPFDAGSFDKQSKISKDSLKRYFK